jgi:hypothetical protein
MMRREHPEERTPFTTYRSHGLHVLVSLLPPSYPLAVLDLGPALRTNVDFWSRYPCRLHIRDLYRDRAGLGDFAAEKERDEFFAAALSFEDGIRFDVILAWDLFNYLGQEDLAAMIRRLSGGCKPGALMFALVSSQPQIPAAPNLFRILDAEQITYESRTSEMQLCPRHQPRDLARLANGFDISHSFLLRNGIQEFLFTRKQSIPA